MDPHDDEWLSRPAAAKFLGVGIQTLANLAAQKKGPPFWNPNSDGHGGRTRYPVALLKRWRTGDRRFLGLQTSHEPFRALEADDYVVRRLVSVPADQVKISQFEDNKYRTNPNRFGDDLGFIRHAVIPTRRRMTPREAVEARIKSYDAWFAARLPQVQAMLALPPTFEADEVVTEIS